MNSQDKEKKLTLACLQGPVTVLSKCTVISYQHCKFTLPLGVHLWKAVWNELRCIPYTFIFWGKYKSILWAYIIVDYILI